MFTIGEISKLVNVSANTLRYYDEIGLLQPAEKNEQSSYRYYTNEQVGKLMTIMELKYYGFSLNEIKELIFEDNSKLLIALEKKLIDLSQAFQADEMRIKVIKRKLGELIMDKDNLILLMECSNFERMLIKDILVTHGYKNIIEATNGKEMYELYEKHRPDLIITGIVCPVWDGIYAMDKILEQNSQTKYIFCSSMSQIQILLNHKTVLGSVDFIAKPLTPQRLIESILKAFERTDTSKINDNAITELQNKVKLQDNGYTNNLTLNQNEVDKVFYFLRQNNRYDNDELNDFLISLSERYSIIAKQTGTNEPLYYLKNHGIGFDDTYYQRVSLNIAMQKEICSQFTKKFNDIHVFQEFTVDFGFKLAIEMFVLVKEDICCATIKHKDKQVGGLIYSQKMDIDIDSFKKNFFKLESHILKCDLELQLTAEEIALEKNIGYILISFLDKNHNVVSVFLENDIFLISSQNR